MIDTTLPSDRSDGDAEAVLAMAGIRGSYEVIQFADIDWTDSNRNRGRTSPVDKSLVDTYAAEMRRGVAFPAICVRRVAVAGARVRYVILGGMHRATAKQQIGATSSLALVVSCDSATAQALAGRLNAVMGRRTGDDERMEQAVDMCRKHGWSRRDAAEWCCVERSTLSQRIKCAEAREFMASHGVPSADLAKVSSEKLVSVAGIEARPMRLAVAELAVASGDRMKFAEFRRVVDAAMKLDAPESDRIEAIKSEVQKCKRTKRAPASMSKSSAAQIAKMIDAAESLAAKFPTRESAMMDDAERADLLRRWRECCEKISTTLGG